MARTKVMCIADHGLRPDAGPMVHEFTRSEMERIVYTLQAMYAGAVCSPDDGEKELLGTDPYIMQQMCLTDVLALSNDSESYYEWTQGIVDMKQPQT